jgi:FtsP/CotA-like multicopper oxidase with cupredoxin domain
MNRRMSLLAILAVLVVGVVAATAYLTYARSNSTPTSLPAWCVRPQGGYLIVADMEGYNDSMSHDVPNNAWPVIDVAKGSNVTISICNTDNQAHGFQIRYYYDSKIESVAPGQMLTVSFIATQKGAFAIYCDIFCTVHALMVSGKLVVS